MVLPAVFIFLLTSGCTSGPGQQTMAWKAPSIPWKWARPFSSKQKSADQAQAVATIEKPSKSTPDTKQTKEVILASNSEEVITHNVELLAHINEELKDASPQERAHYLNSFKGVDPDMIKNILRTRRMVNNMKQQHSDQQLAEQAPAQFSRASLPGLGHTQPGGAPSQVIQTGAQTTAPAGQLYSGNPQINPATNPVQLGNLETAGGSEESSLPTIVPTQPQAYSTSETISKGLNHLPGVGALKTKLSSAFQQGTSALQNGISRTSTAIIGQSESPSSAQQASTVPSQPTVQQPTVQQATVQQSANLDAAQTISSADVTPISSEDQLGQLISVAESEIAKLQIGSTPEEKQQYIERHVHLRMLYLISGQHERALEAIPGIDPADQEFWQQTFWAVANYFDHKAIPDQADRATQTVAQLRQATSRLQEKANLKLKNVAFCHKINSFGSYERFERDEYTPGRPVLVYAEIDNFTSELTGDGMYRTLLKSKIQIFKAGTNGDLVAEIPFDTTEDLCRSVRNDYFHSYKFEIPRNISLGPHVMKLTVVDEISQKVATYTQNFTVR